MDSPAAPAPTGVTNSKSDNVVPALYGESICVVTKYRLRTVKQHIDNPAEIVSKKFRFTALQEQ